MSPIRIAAFFAVAAASVAARADTAPGDPSTTLYGDARLTYQHDPAPARAAARKVAESCAYSPFARIGPSAEQRRRCKAASDGAVAVGPDASRALLETLDDPGTPRTAAFAMYDLVGRIGDAAVAEPLVRALERIASGRFAARRFEVGAVAAALATLTYASVGERAPWAATRFDDGESARAWRAWLAAHRGADRAAWREERIADARTHAADPSLERAYLAAAFLAGRAETRGEGVDALRKLLRRRLDDQQRSTIDAEVVRATHA